MHIFYCSETLVRGGLKVGVMEGDVNEEINLCSSNKWIRQSLT
jgi:hypothetical protein